MPVYNLSSVLGMPNDQINSMFSNPTFQQDFGQMFANNPNMYSGVGNLFTNNPTFKSAFQTLMGQQDWSNPSSASSQTGGGGGGGGGGGFSPDAPPLYTGPGANPYQMMGGQPPNYASMYQPPSQLNLSRDPNTGQYGMTTQGPQAPVPATSMFDPASMAQFGTQMPTAASLQAQIPQTKAKSPTFFEQIAPILGTAASVAKFFL